MTKPTFNLSGGQPCDLKLEDVRLAALRDKIVAELAPPGYPQVWNLDEVVGTIVDSHRRRRECEVKLRALVAEAKADLQRHDPREADADDLADKVLAILDGESPTWDECPACHGEGVGTRTEDTDDDHPCSVCGGTCKKISRR